MAAINIIYINEADAHRDAQTSSTEWPSDTYGIWEFKTRKQLYAYVVTRNSENLHIVPENAIEKWRYHEGIPTQVIKEMR